VSMVSWGLRDIVEEQISYILYHRRRLVIKYCSHKSAWVVEIQSIMMSLDKF